METFKYFFTSLVLFFSSFFNTTPVKDIQVVQPVIVTPQNIATTSNKTIISEPSTKQEKSELIYTNKQLGFSITFPESWSGYRYKEATATVSFGIKDQDDVFLISVYTKKEWADLEDEFKDGGPMPEKLKENEKYVYSYAKSQDSTDLVFPLRKDINAILDSLKLD